MSLGVVLLVHTAFDRAAQVARHWADAGCGVVIHVDAKVPRAAFRAFRDRFAGEERVRFCKRVRVEWGTWSLVAATQIASARLLEAFPDATHVYLASGACLPLRPVAELESYLADRPGTDFIESVAVAEADWAIDGLEAERFTLRFPFSWRKRRKLFDAWTEAQRKLGLTRRLPDGLAPHLGSQWWCLTRETLQAILEAPDRRVMDAYFASVWIPDESYFQSLARRHSARIESRSLTLAKFDLQGKPHIFYDDHRPLLERSDCFVARKIWPGAEALYATFLDPDRPAARLAEPDPGKIDRVFSRANQRRANGRAGLLNQGRFPKKGREGKLTAAPYAVFCGLDALYPEWEPWLARRLGGRVHGHLFHPDGAEFAGREAVTQGCLSADPALRDYRPEQFLGNLIWNTRGERQAWQFGPADTQAVAPFLLRDRNATFTVVSGAWAVPLLQSERPFDEIRAEIARLQRVEAAFLRLLDGPEVAARVHRWTLAEFAAGPADRLDPVLAEIAGREEARPLPEIRDLSDIPALLQRLRDAGVKPTVMGDFGVAPSPAPRVGGPGLAG
ncbi:beta-1,6-N-acetylglucosaminyltransferase [Jannaschia seohaensis]|uniref:Peptide O-xylosyltransferase n=1 Tax=Jannaschia seohaensis TaxID=475081 RepID=A0A2Y9A7A7_9RHOB|nr:beta-1,6-N-acetylglucosaminyltransferase [Jannaschia seohaensis]PWJ21779.1 core-2/I-Branching enzyme [Jannaschia seohaensis]SSA38057.1 Core-2/I-Branching enzyme [Jannaschia seohaensis]